MIASPVDLNAVKANWRTRIAPYQHSDLRQSFWQLANTLLPLFGLWVLMILSLRVSYWLTLALIIPTSAFQVRTFIIFHDCGHGSFFKSHKANSLVGFFLGVLVFTPSEDWWHQHALHHATAGNLDKRGHGDVMTWTAEEYMHSSPFKRLVYGFFRHPMVLFSVGPIYIFLLASRFIRLGAGNKERRSVVFTDLALLAIFALMSLLIGWDKFLMIQLPLIWLAGAVGIWLFYIQHQFENAYWVRDSEWDFSSSALLGASYYKLPRPLQWFSGNIGFHHIHHLSPRIPNYLLEKCFDENPSLQIVETFTLRSGINSLSLRLWDENARKMVSFQAIRKLNPSLAIADQKDNRRTNDKNDTNQTLRVRSGR